MGQTQTVHPLFAPVVMFLCGWGTFRNQRDSDVMEVWTKQSQ